MNLFHANAPTNKNATAVPLEVTRDTSKEMPVAALLINLACVFGAPQGLPSRRVRNETNRISTGYLKKT